ncbi:MAG: hypothetical protein IPN29_10160 [Saprospiraceae bacterium]|nr:hypothetical protein [Saprospiraceae bacterium]
MQALCAFNNVFQTISAQTNPAITVYAGENTIICNSDTLMLNDLSASISGLVNDGYWFTTGDGYFLPSGDDNCQFSLGTAYLPGPADIQSGGFDLLLVSFDPDGFGPMVQVTDLVHITLMGNIAIACNSNLNIALGPDCTQTVYPNMLATSLQNPTEFYTLEIRDASYHKIPGNVLNGDHIGQVLEYTVGHKCGTNTCWGNIRVQDKLPPSLQCSNKTVWCGAYTQADSLGLPIPAYAKAIKTAMASYRVANWDACGPATLSYTDNYLPLLCETGIQGRITRTWSATDSFGNFSSCAQVITIKNRSLSQVVLPPNYDGITKPAFECDSIWPATAEGYPAPDTTGMPDVSGCSNMETTYQDTKISACGASYKLIRKWTIINWCGSLLKEHIQLIKVIDSKPPLFECVKDTLIPASPYSCATALYTLPSPKIVSDCSEVGYDIYLRDYSTNLDFTSYINEIDTGGYAIENLPLGQYLAEYIIWDVCGNKDTCHAVFTVADKSAPIAICDQFTKVSLGQDGTARLFAGTLDDGSIDNCAITDFKVAKMTDICSNQPLLFTNYVDFCCAESNTSIMVALKVTDVAGNANSCMVEVLVQDKLSPVIYCPTNLTISCRNPYDPADLSSFGRVASSQSGVSPIIIFDDYNSGIAGYDGYFNDNCTGLVSVSIIDSTRCSQGKLFQVFVVTDAQGNSSSCTQQITILDPDPFDISNIVFPPNIDLDGCRAEIANPDITGRPAFTNTSCANVAATKEDQVFTFTDGACVKIIRKWTVIDWCQFDATTGEGIWTRLQVIKLSNQIKPVIHTICKDTSLCVFNDNCGSGQFTWQPFVSDDCAPDSLLIYHWKIDLYNDGQHDVEGTTKKVIAQLPLGKHNLVYIVRDQCGNETTCSFFVTAVDCKKPTPYCIGSLTSVIMPSTGNLSIHAKSFNLDSYDNCTPASQLVFSFSNSKTDSIRIFTCADITNGINDTINLNMWVTDLDGNQEYCQVDFILSDNNDACADVVNTASIAGNIYKPDLSGAVTGVEILVEDQLQAYTAIALTDASGKYNISGLPSGLSYVVKPSKNDSISEGLSTLDVVLTQRHILGVTRFTDPTKIIAADLDGNKKISVSDLVILRKIILGATNQLPNERDCYTFVDKKHEFANNNLPFDYPDYIYLPSLVQGFSKANDFIAIKLGDVNHSLQLGNELATPRTISEPELFVKTEGKITAFYSAAAMEMSGFQLAIPMTCTDGMHLSVNQKFEGDWDYVFTDNVLNLIGYPQKVTNLEKNEMLFSVSCEPEKSHSKETRLQSEYYDTNLTTRAFRWAFSPEIETTNVLTTNLVLKQIGSDIQIWNDSETYLPGTFLNWWDVSGRKISSLPTGPIRPGSNVFHIPFRTSPELMIASFISGGRMNTLKVISQ